MGTERRCGGIAPERRILAGILDRASAVARRFVLDAIAVIWAQPLGPLWMPAEAATGVAAVEKLDTADLDFHTLLPRALKGDPVAAYAIARAYATGGARAEDFGEAAAWFRRAAEFGHPAARQRLGALYAKGLGVPRDYVKAYVWFALAAEHPDHSLDRDQALELRDMMTAFLTPEQRAEAERLAAEWREKR